MKRGVFMLILKFNEERERFKKSEKRFYKKVKNNEYKRYSLNINGKAAIVLELTEKDLQCEDVLTLLKIYKGRVLVSSAYADEEILKEYLFNPRDYYQRALLSSLVNQMKTVNKDWKNVSVKIDDFTPFKEFYELVRISKTVTIITNSNVFTYKFLKECYYEYGAIVTVKKDVSTEMSDVFLDLNEIDNNGKLMINVKGKEFLLYPDTRYFDNYVEYQKLLPFQIEHNIICSAFSDK